MSAHDEHLPRKDINKAAEVHEDDDPVFVRAVARGQGDGTKRDAKDAKASTRIGKWGKRK